MEKNAKEEVWFVNKEDRMEGKVIEEEVEK